MSTKREILNSTIASEKIIRLSLEIAERLTEVPNPIYLIGIKTGGHAIALKIAAVLQNYTSSAVHVQKLTFQDNNIAFPVIDCTLEDLNEASIVIIDDVSNSGRTMFYALKPFMNVTPHSIQSLVLVERQHKTFPIKSDFVGSSIATTENDYIQVEIKDGEIAGAYLEYNN